MVVKAKNPQGFTIVFNEDEHTYFIEETGRKLTGVTTFNKQFFPEFDLEYWSYKKAMQWGVTQESVKAKWKAKADYATSNGHLVHQYAEFCLTGERPLPDPNSERTERLFRRVDESILMLLRYFFFVDAEKIVFSPELGLSGTIDLVMQNKKTKGIALLDWKQNAEIKRENSFDNCLPPIAHLESCDFVKYSMQLSMYKKISDIENYFPGQKIETLGLIHLLEDQSPVNIPIKYRGEEIELMLESACL